VRYVPLAREKQGFISYRIERSEIYRILCNKIYRTSLLVFRDYKDARCQKLRKIIDKR
jgi:hypothetical protein